MHNPESIIVTKVDVDSQIGHIEIEASNEFLSAGSCHGTEEDERSMGCRTYSMLSQLSCKQSDALTLSEIGSVIGSSRFLSMSFLHNDQVLTDSQKLDAIAAAPSLDYLDTVMENSEYIDTVQGRIPLAKAARMIANDGSKHSQIFTPSDVRKIRNDCYRKLICIGAAFLCLFGSCFALRNLQSSLPGHDPSLGLITFGCLRSLTWLGGLISSPIISKIRPKRTMVLAATVFCLYPISNFYPRPYTMIPSALLSGLGAGIILNSGGVYMINLSAKYALASRRPLTDVVGRFNSVIAMMFQSSHLVGNLLSYLILSNKINRSGGSDNLIDMDLSNSSSTSTYPPETAICGRHYYTVDQQLQAASHVDYQQYLLLFGVYTALALLGVVFCAALKPLQTMSKLENSNVLHVAKNFLKAFVNCKMLLVGSPYSIYLGLAISITTADYNKMYVACAYGVNYIGFILFIAAFFSIAGAFIPGRIISKTGRIPIFFTAALTGTGSLVTMLLWEPMVGKLQVIAFIPVILWALSDGIMLTQIFSFMGEMFRTELIFAYSVHHFCYALGNMLGTFCSAFQWLSLTHIIYIALALLWISFILLVCSELSHKYGK